MSDSVLTQKIILDHTQYVDAMNEVNNSVKSGTTEMNKSFTEHSKVLAQNEKQVRTWGMAFKQEMVSAGNALKDNVLTGLKAMTLGAGTMAFKKGLEDATSSIFSFSKAFAEIKSKSNASANELDKWQSSLRSIATKTTANVDSMAESFNMLFNEVGNKDDLLNIMGSIGNAAAMGNGNAASVSAQVQQALHNEGKEMTKANVDEFLGASNVLRRNGVGVDHLQDSNGALAGINTKGTGLNIRQIANIMSAATATSGSAAGVDAVKSLITNDLEKSVRLSAALGLKQNKSGQLDLSSLGSEGYSKKVMGLGSTDQMRLMAIKGITGASDEAAQAFLDIAKKSQEFGGALQKAAGDTETFEQSAEKAKQNLENAYHGMMNGITQDISSLFKHFETPLISLMGAIKNHPVVAGAAGLAVAGVGGALIRSLGKDVLGKIPGLGGAAGMAGGIAEGKALQETAGVTPVFVVNASEIGGDSNPASPGFLGKMGSLLGGGGLGRAALATGGVGLAAGVGVGAGMIVNKGVELASTETDQYGRKSDALDRGLNWLANKTGAISDEQYQFMSGKQQAQVVKVEVDSKDPQFSARPKSTDMARDARTQ